MMNEAHDGLRRCRRTRVIGRRILPTARALGVRHLAMEALGPPGAWRWIRLSRFGLLPRFGNAGYLDQPEMRELIRTAIDLGFRLSGYEADPRRAPKDIAADTLTLVYTNWREERQAANLADLLTSLPADDKLLVWCGNGHLYKGATGEWVPMGVHFGRLTGVEAFALDQTVTVAWGHPDQVGPRLLELTREQLRARGGTAGFLREAGPLSFLSGSDAHLPSLENALD